VEASAKSAQREAEAERDEAKSEVRHWFALLSLSAFFEVPESL